MYPDDSIQYLVNEWWQEDDGKSIRRGRLIKVFIPYVDQSPMALVVEGRTEATIHNRINYRLETLDVRNPPKAPILPVAALPTSRGEIRTVYRAKKRPAIILSCGGPDIPAEVRGDSARWQTNPTLLVAPYFGTEHSGMRGGWKDEFVERIKHCEYPQYIWDKLPLDGQTSVLRIDHLQPIGRDLLSFELTPFCLGEEAMRIIDEWLLWLLTGKLAPNAIIPYVREQLLSLEKKI